MTLTIEIDAETTAFLSAEAQRRHSTLEAVAVERLHPRLSASLNTGREAAFARIRSGFYQTRLSSVDEFIAHKREDKAREDRERG